MLLLRLCFYLYILCKGVLFYYYTSAVDSATAAAIDVKNVFYVFYFKIKNAFFNVFYFPNFFINKKRWPTVPALTICG